MPPPSPNETAADGVPSTGSGTVSNVSGTPPPHPARAKVVTYARRIVTVIVTASGGAMSFMNIGFTGRRRERDDRLPPGQTLAADWPVLSAGPTPQIEPENWTFTISTETGVDHRWGWLDLETLGVEDVTTDIHCVTHWSKLAMSWRGVPLDRFFEQVDTSVDYVMARSYGGYTTNIPLDDLLGGRAWIAIEADGEPLTPEHGGPARLLVPHLYFWKSAKWIGGMRMMSGNDPGFWEQNGYHLRGDPWREERYW